MNNPERVESLWDDGVDEVPKLRAIMKRQQSSLKRRFTLKEKLANKMAAWLILIN